MRTSHCSVLFRRRKPLKKTWWSRFDILPIKKGGVKSRFCEELQIASKNTVNIILKLYSEGAYISYFFKLANINRFFETTLSHMDALTPSRTLYRQDLSGSYDITSAINRGSAPPHCCVCNQSFQYLHSKRTCYCAVIISSPPTISLKCCEKALKDDRHIASVAKLLLTARGSPQVRGLQASACLFQRFHASDRTQYM